MGCGESKTDAVADAGDVRLEGAELMPRQTQRRNFLTTVEELVGPPPAGQTWRDEFTEAIAQDLDLNGQVAAARDCRQEDNEENIAFYLQTDCDGMSGEKVGLLVANGWAKDDAEAVMLLPDLAPSSLRRALDEGRRDLAASCHALVRVLAGRAAATGDVAPPLYRALRGIRRDGRPFPGLVEIEPGFAFLEESDATDFRKLTALAPLSLISDPNNMGEDGYRAHDQKVGDEFVTLPGDVVCILSRPNDAAGFHTAVQVAYDPPTFMLPPNVLLQLVKVEGPPFTASFPRWSPWFKDVNGDTTTYDDLTNTSYFDDGDHYEDKDGNRVECPYDPKATIEKPVNQRLLTCTITYLLPQGDGRALSADEAAALAGAAET